MEPLISTATPLTSVLPQTVMRMCISSIFHRLIIVQGIAFYKSTRFLFKNEAYFAVLLSLSVTVVTVVGPNKGITKVCENGSNEGKIPLFRKLARNSCRNLKFFVASL